ncbi:hypothetical protein ACHMW5_13835 [Azospirillum melinis]|uniref:hypothetical protein n=1 Tax=Azospirillum melinis TaxID=328839 RepID=UPI00375678F2
MSDVTKLPFAELPEALTYAFDGMNHGSNSAADAEEWSALFDEVQRRFGVLKEIHAAVIAGDVQKARELFEQIAPITQEQRE